MAAMLHVACQSYIIKLVCIVPNKADDLTSRGVCSIEVVCLQNLTSETQSKHDNFNIVFLLFDITFV